MLKLIVVGDGAVGKTCALYSYVNDKFPIEYVPTVFENTLTSVNINNEDVQLSLWDTAGQEGYENLRLVSYQGTNIFFICFSVITPQSFENAITKWYSEVQQYSKNGLIIFLGLKIDLRDQANQQHVQTQTAENTIKKLGHHYKEASSLTQQGLKEAFTFAIKAFIQQNQKQNQEKKEKKKSKCQLI